MPADRDEGWLQRAWYGRARGAWVLRPFEWLFRGVAALRRAAYRRGIARTGRVAAPVVVVGNIAVGGSGKTPLVGWLAEAARESGRHPAIVSRGYGGSEPAAPLRVAPDMTAETTGDEPLMLARDTGLPVYVCRDRFAAAEAAVSAGADLVIADDGLQHYALGRDAEIAVVDAQRVHGNGRCLPAGPLREPVSRLGEVDLIVHAHGGPHPHYVLQVSDAVNAATDERRPLSAFAGAPAHVIAGIGHPGRVYALLAAEGIDVRPVAVPDHGRVGPAALAPDDDLPVVMTPKDAVKYAGLGARHWVLSPRVDIGAGDADALRGLIRLAIDRYRERTGSSRNG